MNRGLLSLLVWLSVVACNPEPQYAPPPVTPLPPQQPPVTPPPALDEATRRKLEGVWLFAKPDTPFAGGNYEGIRFDAAARWQLLDVLKDGSLAPAQQPGSGLTTFTLPPRGLTVQMNLHWDTGGGLGMLTNWSQDGQRMSWLGESWDGLLKRASATVAAPFPPSP